MDHVGPQNSTPKPVPSSAQPCGHGSASTGLVNPIVQRVCREASENPERYGHDYWGRVPNQTVYYTGDSAHVDEDGYVWFAGRPDELRGEVIAAFVVLKQGQTPSDQLRGELLATVRRELGPVAVIGELSFVGMVPRTRSGKIMRRVLKVVTLDRNPADITTIEDETSLEEARQDWHNLKEAVAQARGLGKLDNHPCHPNIPPLRLQTCFEISCRMAQHAPAICVILDE